MKDYLKCTEVPTQAPPHAAGSDSQYGGGEKK